jgi:tetratricopeptide (TPR) repeat protein
MTTTAPLGHATLSHATLSHATVSRPVPANPFPAPLDLPAGELRVWQQEIVLPTYPTGEAETLPVFFERRVYQGSNGKVYPLPAIESVGDVAMPRAWQAVIIENAWLQVILLPEIGGRIHRVYDKTIGYDVFYRQDVIKPALVGLAGPWASGGVEFNWPQHHRPSTWMPTDVAIEREADGAVTVWLGEHEPMDRMQGMHGIRLRPDSVLIESRARIVNRTPFTRTFLWWANVAAEVHDQYQSFFPADVRWVADHAVRATSTFPVATGTYYGVDYGARAGANDLSWYRNIPVPTSYMVRETSFDFFGGYDHRAGGGFVHIADRHIAPGKKQWTWGNHPFGHAWDRELTDHGGPYIELMAGVYTDNQPDFTYLAPYETRTFSQCWWPFQALGPVQQADRDLALRCTAEDRRLTLGVAAAGDHGPLRLRLHAAGGVLADLDVVAAPGRPWTGTVDLPAGLTLPEVEVTVTGAKVALAYRAPTPVGEVVVPPPASEPPAPATIASQEELFLTGEHLEQYRHPTRSPETYWQEALRRDPGDARCNIALAHRWLKRGRAADAVPLLRAAIARLTGRHPNPVDGEAHYLLGLALETLGHDDEAWAAHAKATWNAAWRGAASYRLACLAGRRGDHRQVLAFTTQALDANGGHQQARNLRAAWLRRQGAPSAHGEIAALLAANPLDHAAGHLEALGTGTRTGWQARTRRDPQTLLDVALTWAEGGLLSEAIDALEDAAVRDRTTLHALAWLHERSADAVRAAACRAEARTAPEPALFSVRPEEEAILRAAIAATDDAWPAVALGNFLHDKLRHAEAITAWETAVARDATCAAALRNLGIACHDRRHDLAGALDLYQRALAAAPQEARLLFELDQLAKRCGQAPATRLARLEAHAALVEARDDLSIERIALLNRLGRPDEARARLTARRFHPWEGGEGKVMSQHVATHLALCRQALADKDPSTATTWAEKAVADPEHLGEAKHLHAALADIHWHLGQAADLAGDQVAAQRWFTAAAEARKDFSDMAVQAVSRMTIYQALALRDLGRHGEAEAACQRLEDHARRLTSTPATIDYFATSLPDLLVFSVDPNLRQGVQAAFLAAGAAVARGGGRAELEHVLTLDASHQEAAALLADLAQFHP